MESRKAYSYIRFSSPDQARGDSYRRQKASAKAYCLANDLELVDSDEYSFFDKGRSAYKGEHLGEMGQLTRFLNYVKEGIIPSGSVLIVESLDRLSRAEVWEALPRFLDILNQGIDVYTSSDKTLYTSKVDAQQLILSIFNMSRAHNESSLKSERVGGAWRQKQEKARDFGKALGAACPYWIQYVNGGYVLIPERVEVIRDIFRLAENGYGHRTIAKKLNSAGIPVFGSIKRNIHGLWSGSSCARILSNRALIGEYQPTGLEDDGSGVKRQKRGEPVQNFFPIVLSEEEFYSAQAARESRKVTRSSKQSQDFNVWQGLAKCAKCGGPMHLVNKGTPPKGGKYLRCYVASKGGCSSKLIKLTVCQVVFKEMLAKINSISLVKNTQADLNRELNVVESKIGEVRSRQQELKEQVLSLGGRLPPLLVSIMSELDEQLVAYKERQERIKVEIGEQKITSKDDFFARLDLVSFEGRARANALAKRLNIVVEMERRENDAVFRVRDIGGFLFSIIYDDSGHIGHWGNSIQAASLITAHGDEIALSKSVPELAVGEHDIFDLAREVAGLEAEYREIQRRKELSDDPH